MASTDNGQNDFHSGSTKGRLTLKCAPSPQPQCPSLVAYVFSLFRSVSRRPLHLRNRSFENVVMKLAENRSRFRSVAFKKKSWGPPFFFFFSWFVSRRVCENNQKNNNNNNNNYYEDSSLFRFPIDLTSGRLRRLQEVVSYLIRTMRTSRMRTLRCVYGVAHRGMPESKQRI